MKNGKTKLVLRIGGWALLLAAALWPRLLGYNRVPLWLDEAWRANVILDDGWFGHLFDGSTTGSLVSAGYAIFVRSLSFFGSTEGILRLSSLLPGVAAVLLITLVVGLATESRLLGWLAGLVAAINPMFVGYAKELKPYSFELCVHLLLLFIALKYIEAVRRDSARLGHWTVICLLAGPAAALASPNLVFLLPGWFIAVFVATWKFSPRHLWFHFVSATIALLLVAVQYRYSWSHASDDAGLIRYWQDGFFSGDMPRLQWIAAQFNNMTLRAVDSTRAVFPARNEPFYLAVAVLALAGVAGSISVREPSRFLLFVSPLLAVIVANARTIWPLGPIRVNMFLFGYLIVLVFIGGSQLRRWVGRVASERVGRHCHWGVVTLFLFYGGLAFVRVMPFARNLGPPNEDFPGALRSLLQKIPEGRAERPLVLINSAASHALSYYTVHHSEHSGALGATLRDRTEVLIGDEAYSGPEKFLEVVARRSADQPVWFLYSHCDLAVPQDAVARFGEIKGEYEGGGAGSFELVLRR